MVDQGPAAGPWSIGVALAAGSLASVAIARRLASQPIEGVDMPRTPPAPQTEENTTASNEARADRRRVGRGGRWGAVAAVIAMAVTAVSAASLIAQTASERVTIGEIPVPEGAAATIEVFNPGPPPVSLALPTIGVESELDDLRLAADGTLNVPRDAARAGWWSQGVAPGDPGPAVIVGHVDSYDGPGIFQLLHRLQPGEEAVVRRNDGTSLTFVVDAVHQFDKEAFPNDIVYGATAEPTLRLITCGGSFDKRTRSYSDNVIVFAHLKTAEPT